MKKILALFIITAIFTTFTITVSAKFNDVNNSGYATEISALNDSGILQGDDNGNFRPEDEITRAEFAAVLCRAVGAETEATTEEMKNKNYFTDVPPTHWAAGYINTAYNYGAVNGVWDGIFMPEDAIKNEQVIKMLVAAWGYASEAEDLGGYPNGYMEIAYKYGVLDAVSFNYGNASKRWVVSMFVHGVLEKLPVAENAERKHSPPIIISTETLSIERDDIWEHSKYIEDPISVLKNVSNESLKYEKIRYEQSVPENMFPFVIVDNMLYGTADSLNYYMQITNPNEKKPFVGGIMSNIEGISLENLPKGEWRISFICNIGAISDQYSHVIVKNETEVCFQGFAQRHTALQIRHIQTEERYDVEISNTMTDEHFPFEISTASDGNGKTVLYVDYSQPIDENQFFHFDMTGNDRILYSMANPIEGPIEKITPISVENLEIDVEYAVQIIIAEKTGGDVAFKGFLTIQNDSDFILKGSVRKLVIHGYEIADLE